MRDRALVHVAGPAGSGKTTFVERLLDAEVAFAICVRSERDAKLRRARESAPKNHSELQRYREAGASAVALYQFSEPSADAFFTRKFMEDYSEAVFIEGDCPLDYVDLAAFVAPAPHEGRALLRRALRDHTASHQASNAQLSEALESKEAIERLIATGVGESLLMMALERPGVLDNLRRSSSGKLTELRRSPPPDPTEHWVLEEGYEGIEIAQLVVVNARNAEERGAAERLVEDLGRIRKDDSIYREIVGLRGNKVPITVVIADLTDRKDVGLRKAIARVKRATKRREW